MCDRVVDVLLSCISLAYLHEIDDARANNTYSADTSTTIETVHLRVVGEYMSDNSIGVFASRRGSGQEDGHKDHKDLRECCLLHDLEGGASARSKCIPPKTLCLDLVFIRTWMLNRLSPVYGDQRPKVWIQLEFMMQNNDNAW